MSKKVVVASGYFDPLHYGHIEYLQRSKELGDTLIVIVNNDEQAKLAKGGSFMPVHERVKLIRALSCVDTAMEAMDQDRSVCKTLALLHPHIFTNGGNQFNDMIPEANVCLELGIKMEDCLGNSVHSSKMPMMIAPSTKPQEMQMKDTFVAKPDVVSAVRKTLEALGGIILASRSMVYREMYNGRNVLAPNSGPGNADHRGYVPVERWIMSKTLAENPAVVEGEGISLLRTVDGDVRLDWACEDRVIDFSLFGGTRNIGR